MALYLWRHDTLPVFHFHVISYLSGLMIPSRTGHYPTAQTEIDGWFKEPCPSLWPNGPTPKAVGRPDDHVAQWELVIDGSVHTSSRWNQAYLVPSTPFCHRCWWANRRMPRTLPVVVRATLHREIHPCTSRNAVHLDHFWWLIRWDLLYCLSPYNNSALNHHKWKFPASLLSSFAIFHTIIWFFSLIMTWNAFKQNVSF